MKRIKIYLKFLKLNRWARIALKKLPQYLKYYVITYYSDDNSLFISFSCDDRLFTIFYTDSIKSWLDLIVKFSDKYERYYHEKSITTK